MRCSELKIILKVSYTAQNNWGTFAVFQGFRQPGVRDRSNSTRLSPRRNITRCKATPRKKAGAHVFIEHARGAGV